VAERGSTLPPGSPELDDVPDPWGRDERAYAAAVTQIVHAVDVVAHWLRESAGTR